MAKIVNSWNEWDPLKTGSALTAPGPDWQYNAASGGMLHCNALDIHREGGRVDYFPNQ